ncbi:hypothetical protein HMPREF1557_00770 [Streptococcus sobrinus W1703]|uniref:Uncharacterized protein n=1 Tax=Streptococcus sobrinus W1703 TaxID=1227275 RepID=U2KPI3_9STRE|nr:hypothetical protein HMPREF1557_00770 [Streptococcus sobrinus W1703]
MQNRFLSCLQANYHNFLILLLFIAGLVSSSYQEALVTPGI